MLHYVGRKAKGTKKLKIKTYQVTIIEYFPKMSSLATTVMAIQIMRKLASN